MNLRRTRAVARKEFLHILRDPRSLVMALALPLLMILLFGYALTLDVDRIPTVVYDSDLSPESRELITRFQYSRYFQIVGAAANYRGIEERINRDECMLGIVIPQDYTRDLLLGRAPQVQLLFDGSDSNTASIALSYANGIVQVFAQEIRERAQNRMGRNLPRRPGRTAAAHLVQQPAEVKELHRPRTYRAYPDDHRRAAHLPYLGP
jgi:ABC-2 type transport system permease protein